MKEFIEQAQEQYPDDSLVSLYSFQPHPLICVHLAGMVQGIDWLF